MSKRKNLKAYVRLDKNRKPVPGSLIYRKDKPYGEFAPMVNPYGDICCPPETVCGLGFVEYAIGFTGINRAIFESTDAECNTYLLYRLETPVETPPVGYNGTFSLAKRDKDGNLVWNKQLNFNTVGVNYFQIYQLLVDSVNSYIYVGGEGSLLKLDLDGNVVWARYFNELVFTDFWYLSVYSLSPDGSFVYAAGGWDPEGSSSKNFTIKIDGATGNIVKATSMSPVVDNAVALTKDAYGITTDKFGNSVINVASYFSADIPNRHLIKVDADLNVIWATAVGPVNQQTAGSTPVADYNGDIYVYNRTYGSTTFPYDEDGVLKVDGDTGQVLWKGLITNTFYSSTWYAEDYRIGNDNSLYMTTWDGAGYQVLKMSSSGVLQYVNQINTPLTPSQYYWNTALTGSNPTNGYLLAPSWSNTSPNSDMYNFKVPLKVVEGTYGPFTFIDTTADYTFVKYPVSFDPAASWVVADVTSTFQAGWAGYVAGTVNTPNIFTLQLIS